ncbi:MAG: 4-(cytidine 5'-diphospho)-2-C-methyl-D-erythritol kinase, partial [Alistipes sp.]|nr:4-(cytidine 5'-diphospho)-2-C-methyl-D-erythritol kinase [Alistipes sp.]
MKIKANCKINIGLDVLRRREDGFHDLSTVMFPVRGLYDIVEVEPIEGNAAEFRSLGLRIDCPDEDNICV